MPPVSLEILERNIFFLISCFSVILLLNSHILLCVTFPTKSYFQCILHFDLSFSFLPFKLTNSRSPALAIFQNFVFYIGVQLINNVVMTSGVQQSGSVIHMYLSILFHILLNQGHITNKFHRLNLNPSSLALYSELSISMLPLTLSPVSIYYFLLFPTS